MVCHVRGTCYTLVVMVSTEKLYLELKSNSDMHLALLHMLANSKFPLDPVDLAGTIPDHIFVHSPQDLV